MTGTAAHPAAQAHVEAVVDQSGTSFRWSMKLLPETKRQAMYAVYAFCREVDDIADEPGARERKERELDAWRDEIAALYDGRPSRPTTNALADAMQHFRLPQEAFLAVIEGMAMDLRGEMRAPSEDDLRLYCDRVAGAVGRLSLPIFGGAGGFEDDLARALGEALQLTNILRDLGEDARLGRLYLPRERLRAHGIEGDDPSAVLAHPNVAAVCAEMAQTARDRFAESAALIARGDRALLRPCRVMMAVYRRILDGLERRGWGDPAAPYELPKSTKLWLALRHGLF
jgi:squalene synthase HpnD